MDMKKFLLEGQNEFLPNLSIDHVIVGYQHQQLQCLLLRIEDKWILPGGYVGRQEAVDHASIRILKERTGLHAPHLKFLSVFGNSERRFGSHWEQLVTRISGIPFNKDFWINDRFVTLAYYSLVPIEKVEVMAGEYDEEIAWHSFDALPEMWLDHKEIANTARQKLKTDLQSDQLSFNLLPEEFTMPELHQLHEHILDKKIDRSRFQKTMLAGGQFERLPERKKESPGRNPYLYKVKKA